MGFPVQVCAAGVLPKVLIMTVAIAISMLARSLLCWLLGSSYFLDDDEELYISSNGNLLSIYALNEEDNDDSVEDARLSYPALEAPAMRLHTSHQMHPYPTAIAQFNEENATSFIDTQSVEVAHGHGGHFDTVRGAPMQDAMSLTSCRVQPYSARVYAIANLDETDADLPAHHNNCCVCLCNVHPSSGKRLPRCAHVLHSSCLAAWLHHGHMKVCPLCRTPASLD